VVVGGFEGACEDLRRRLTRPRGARYNDGLAHAEEVPRLSPTPVRHAYPHARGADAATDGGLVARSGRGCGAITARIERDGNSRDDAGRACELIRTAPESLWVPTDQKVDVAARKMASARDLLTLVLTTALDEPGRAWTVERAKGRSAVGSGHPWTCVGSLVMNRSLVVSCVPSLAVPELPCAR
jgi:hypothetical protein